MKRCRTVPVRCNDREYEQLKELADIEGLSISAYVRFKSIGRLKKEPIIGYKGIPK